MLKGINTEESGTRSAGTITRERGSGRKKKMESKSYPGKGESIASPEKRRKMIKVI